jgi:hypothetical protein
VVLKVGEATQSLSAILYFRNVDNDKGMVDGESIKIFSGYAYSRDMKALIKEMRLRRDKGETLSINSLTADPYPLLSIMDKGGAVRIISLCMLLTSIVALLDTLRLLHELKEANKGTAKVIWHNFFLGSILLSLLANCARILFFIDPMSTQGIIIWDIARPLLSLQEVRVNIYIYIYIYI